MFEYFPDNYSWSLAIMIALGSDSINMTELDDACRPLKKIAKGNDDTAQEAWYESWKRVAEHVEKLAQIDKKAEHPLSAGRKYLRACVYYLLADRMVSNLDPRKVKIYLQALRAFKEGVTLKRDRVEFVEVPFQGASLPALFVPAVGEGPAPCIIHFDGFDVLKETLYLNNVGDAFRRRGVSLLIVDHPGVGEALRLRNMCASPETEIPAAACVDYLERRSDVDPKRIGIMAVSLGGYYAPRAAAFEKRLKCCVAWGGIWDAGKQLEDAFVTGPGKTRSVPSFQLLWVFGKKTVEDALQVAKRMTLEGVAEKITCPLLVMHGENDRQVPLFNAEKTIKAAVNSPGRKLKVFTVDEGGAEHCQVDNGTLAIDYAADWVAETLGAYPQGL
jgi:dienelactone hydrolase